MQRVLRGNGNGSSKGLVAPASSKGSRPRAVGLVGRDDKQFGIFAKEGFESPHEWEELRHAAPAWMECGRPTHGVEARWLRYWRH